MKLPAWMNHPVVRKILNLEPVPDPGTKPEQVPAAQPVEKPPAPGAGENPQDTAEFFTPIPTKPTIGQRIFRILAFSVLILLVWIGVRTVIWGNQSRQAAAPVPISATFPAATAEGTASRAAVAFLTWQEGEAGVQARAAALKPYFSTLGVDADGKMGWNGKGTQRAENPTVMRVQVIDETTARVLVVVDVVRGETRTTTGLEMTVKVIDGAAAVVGTPGVVAVPTAPTIKATAASQVDSELTQATKPEAQSFFSIFATSDSLDSVAAPGAKIHGLAGAWGTAKVATWAVNAGDDKTRTATAEVTFEKDGVQLKQVFTLSLVKVSGPSADQWKISEIHGG
ncbi:conjugal transfer protein (plasmid) [Rothia mucilaginosa]|uniref:conjugal transfer protein n=1 Tax=Rothia mucilaginosa TaxID=43675 RepID=UPI0039A20C6F